METVRAEPVEACDRNLREAQSPVLRQYLYGSALRQAQGERN